MSIHVLLVQNQHVPALVLVNPYTSSHPSTDINGSIQMRLLCLEDPREVCGTHPWATFVKMIIKKAHILTLQTLLKNSPLYCPSSKSTFRFNRVAVYLHLLCGLCSLWTWWWMWKSSYIISKYITWLYTHAMKYCLTTTSSI